jgi:hypothetical protein
MRICNVGQRRKKPSPGRYRVRPLPQADFLTYYAAILGVFSTADSRFF